MVIDVIKCKGKRAREEFQPLKLRQSIIAVCISVKAPEGEAEKIAQRVTDAVTLWSSKKPAITSADIRRQAAKHLEKLHANAAHFYKHHRQIF